jgi:uncharacterized membrane protein YoaK (UPF0700 family)
MSDERDRVPLLLQSALVATPLLFIGLPAWILVIVLQLFDIDARAEVGIVMACVLPIALFFFARLCAKHGLIRSNASPVAIALLQSGAAAFALWLLDRLPGGWRSSVGPGGRDEGNVAGAVVAAIIFVAGWVALAMFSRREARAEPPPLAESTPHHDEVAERAGRLPP